MCAVLCDVLEDRTIVGHSCAPRSRRGTAPEIFVEGSAAVTRFITSRVEASPLLRMVSSTARFPLDVQEVLSHGPLVGHVRRNG